MADTTMTYFAKLGLDANDFLNGLSKSQGGLLAFARDVTVTMEMTMEIFDRVTTQVVKFGQIANELRDLSYNTGISTDQLQRFHYAAVISGTSTNTVDGALKKLTISMSQFDDKTSAAAQVFGRLGIDPTGRSADQVFEETALALTSMEDETQRNAIAMEIYGKNWSDLLPLMDTYIEKGNEIKASPVISEKELADLAEAKVGWDRLGNALTIYTGKAMVAIMDIQDQLNKYNLVAKFLFPEETGSTDHVKVGSFGVPTKEIETAAVAVDNLTDKMTRLGNASTRAARETAVAWAASSVVGSEGSEMQLFMQAEMEAGTSYDQALNNWANGTPTGGPQAGTLGALSGNTRKTVADQTRADTKAISTELDKQAEVYTTLNEKIVAGWSDLEKAGLVHYTAMAELSRIRSQAELDYMAECVNFAGGNPIVQNKIIMGAGGPDWVPVSFTPVASPTLKSADFGSVAFLGGAGARDNRNGSTVNITINQENHGIETDAEALNKTLGVVAALGGGVP